MIKKEYFRKQHKCTGAADIIKQHENYCGKGKSVLLLNERELGRGKWKRAGKTGEREKDGLMLALLVGREPDGLIVALLVERDKDGLMVAQKAGRTAGWWRSWLRGRRMAEWWRCWLRGRRTAE